MSKYFTFDVKINEELDREIHTKKNYYTEEEKWKENKRYEEEKQQKKNE